MLEFGEFATIANLAKRKGVASSYIARVLRLTLLAPEVADGILAGLRIPEMGLAQLLETFPKEWRLQSWAGR
jgi:hypothetical protein